MYLIEMLHWSLFSCESIFICSYLNRIDISVVLIYQYHSFITRISSHCYIQLCHISGKHLNLCSSHIYSSVLQLYFLICELYVFRKNNSSIYFRCEWISFFSVHLFIINGYTLQLHKILGLQIFKQRRRLILCKS